MKLYDNTDSGNAYKVRLTLAHLKMPVQRIELDTDSGETRSEAFLAKNPNGKVPALELDSGDIICESNAIVFYLASGTALLPEADLHRAWVLQWMFFEQYSHEPYIAVSRHVLKHLELTEERLALVASKRDGGLKALNVMEQHLSGRSFFVAEQFTIADIALYAYTHVAHEGGFDLSAYEAIGNWLARVAEQPGHVPMADA